MTLLGRELGAVTDITEVLSSRAGRSPNEVVLASREGSLSWGELERSVGRWAGALLSLGLLSGDRVASLMPNRLNLLVHYLACLRRGLVAAPLNYRYAGTQAENGLAKSGARALIAHEERYGEVEQADLDESINLIRYCDAPEEENDFHRLAIDCEPVGVSLTAEDEPAFIFFTSGSTGPAKGVTHTRRTVNALAASAASAIELTSKDTFLPASSMSHIGAFLWSLSSLTAGASVVVASTVHGTEVLSLLREYRPTVLAMIPAALTPLVRDHAAAAADFASVRLARSGADHVPEYLETEFAALTGLQIDEGYGMTEVGLATLSPPSGVIKPGSIGKACPGFAIWLRGADGGDVPVGEVGEVWVESPGATIGYWQDPAATSELMEDGWLNSGDLARADEDGYLWFFGRSKQIIVHDGSNISPSEVEDALWTHEAVASVGVVGVNDAFHGEDVRAYVVRVPGHESTTAEELIHHARARVGYRAPEEVVFVDALPLNPTGKVDRAGLKAMAEDHRNPHRSLS